MAVTAERVPAATTVSDRGLRPPDNGVGFDTLRLRGPARPEILSSLSELRVRQARAADVHVTASVGGWSRLTVAQTQVRVTCSRRTGPLEVAAEFSGPMLHVGNNVEAWPLAHLTETIAHVSDSLARELPGFPRPEACRVVRLDLVRDFTSVDRPAAVLSALAALPTGAKYLQETYSQREDPGLIQTLVRGVRGRWRAHGYDKNYEQAEVAARRASRRPASREAVAPADAGRLRWEVQLGHRTMAQLRSSQLDALPRADDLADTAAAFFHHSEFDRRFQGGQRMLDELLASLANTTEGRRKASRIATYVCALQAGVNLQSRNTVELARADLRRHGVTAAELLTPDGPVTRLDFRSGRLLSSP